jgi:rSAM/selenodomain-associated transferase 1
MPDVHRLVLFSKRPRRGGVKTRLAAALGADLALRLYRAFLADQLRFLRSFAGSTEVEVWLDEPWEADAAFAPLLRSLPIRLQGAGDLGRRLLRCFASGPAGPTLILGSDAPTLPAERIPEAFAALERGGDAVVVPAADGGYVLVGMARPQAELLRQIPWGTPRVLAVTERRAAEAGIVLRRLPTWYDVDELDDLLRLRAELRRPEGARRATETARLLAGLDLGPDGSPASTHPRRA